MSLPPPPDIEPIEGKERPRRRDWSAYAIALAAALACFAVAFWSAH